jgi:hypothetical protein
VSEEYVIRGNSAVLKCSIPSFVSDFVSVISWEDDAGNTYPLSTQTATYGKADKNGHSPPEIRPYHLLLGYGLTARSARVYLFIFFITLIILSTVVEQVYQCGVNDEYVIRGNSAVLKCSIPSFVSDFVTVVSWEDEAGNMFPMKKEPETYGKTIGFNTA